tara:strand:- start:58604 stop:58975 length:372 start_codon:yes stop_codon:yes gene_type:complete
LALFFWEENMKNLTLILTFTFSSALMAFDGFECKRNDGKAVLTAEFLENDKAKITEISEEEAWSYEASFKRSTLPHNDSIAKTRFIFDEYAVLMVYETGIQILGLLQFPQGFPSIYNCQYLEQ